MLREHSKSMQENGVVVKKDIIAKDSQLKRELKAAKMDELRKIEQAIRQDNEKALMSLEEGGRLEQLILQMYKRF
jgi:predicted secreted Zn-dependent protease